MEGANSEEGGTFPPMKMSEFAIIIAFLTFLR